MGPADLKTPPPRGPWIQTYSGRAFHLLDPTPEEVDLADIAHALAFKSRYSGHAKWHYSVAQHCVFGQRYMRSDKEALAFLLHELGEAWLPDIASPLKPTLRISLPLTGRELSWGELERLHTEVALRALGCEELLPLIDSPEVRDMDRRMLMTEAPVLLGALHPGWGVKAEQIRGCAIPQWSPGRAEAEWLHCYQALRGA